MRKLISLLSILIISISVLGQNIPKGANVIVLETNYLTVQDAVKKTVARLIDGGITIANADRELGFINTNPYTHRNVTNQVTISFQESDKGILAKLSGGFLTGIDITIWGVTARNKQETIEYIGQSGSYYMQAWEGLERVAQMIDHSTASFLTPIKSKNNKFSDPLYL